MAASSGNDERASNARSPPHGTVNQENLQDVYFRRALELYHWRRAVPGVEQRVMVAEEFFESHVITGFQMKSCTSCAKDFSGASEYFQECAKGPCDSAKLCRQCIELKVHQDVGYDAKKIKAELRAWRAKYTELAHGRYAWLRFADRVGSHGQNTPEPHGSKSSKSSKKRPLEEADLCSRLAEDGIRNSKGGHHCNVDVHAVPEYKAKPSLFKDALKVHNLQAAFWEASTNRGCFQEHPVRSTHRDPCAQCGANFNELRSYFRVTGSVRKYCRACVEQTVKNSVGTKEEEIGATLRSLGA